MGTMGLTLGAEDTGRLLSSQIWATSTMGTIASLVAPGKLFENDIKKNYEYTCFTAKGMILCMSHCHVLCNLLEIKLLLYYYSTILLWNFDR